MKKNIVITGGTGTLGHALVTELKKDDSVGRVTVFSRDELKQSQMAKQFPKLNFILGSVTDKASLRRAITSDTHTIIHCAALKQVDRLEREVEECISTNVQGTANVLSICEERVIPRFLFSSTDKAVDPINAYGFSKALAERLVMASELRNGFTKHTIFRWGNVLGSRGSVLPMIVSAIRNKTLFQATDPEMTRFWIRIEDAAAFMLSERDDDKTVRIPKMKAARIGVLVQAVQKCLDTNAIKVEITGIRPGEKIHESLESVHHENHINSKTCDQFTIEELTEYIRPVVEKLKTA